MKPHVAVPWYVHPAEDPDAWARLARGEQPTSFVVVNVHDGPGSPDDPYYPVALDSLVRHRLLGYVSLAWGRRPATDVRRDIGTWLDRYPVAGVMLDEFPSGGPTSSWLPAVRAARDLGAGLVVGNPGVVPDPAILEALDVTCVFEGTADAHARVERFPALAGVAPDRIWHLIHSCAPEQLLGAQQRAAELGAGHAFATDRGLPHPWGGLPRALETVAVP